MNVLMACSLVSLPYRVMQCISATGAKVHVLGCAGSAGLRYSRHCRTFIPYRGILSGQRDRAFADAINACVRELGIDMVVPVGPPATRSLIASKDIVDTPCFPLPDLEQFDTLNNKWKFTKLCMKQGISCPPSALYASRDYLLEALDASSLRLPAMAKPLSEDGGHGIQKLDSATARSRIARIAYCPIIVQDFIEGEDIGASVYCEGGEIKAFVANMFRRGTYSTFYDPTIFEAFRRILEPLAVDGVYQCDMRLTPEGKIYFLECNPRFYFKIALAMAAGMNLVHCGLETGARVPSTLRPGTRVRRPWALATNLGRPWSITRRDLAHLWSLASDPIPFVRESLRIDWDR